ncbi:unnamed protein product [Rhizophagus irregularis]|nr:unnamed protein product [Rhizophagus irregularis]
METCKNCRVIGWCRYCKDQCNKYSLSICGYCKTITLLLCNECENPNWSNWSSGNKIVDDFIKECNKPNEVLKWIPYNQFSEITYLAKGGFGEIYKAKWKGAYVVLKKLYDSQNITVDFLNEVKNYILTMESNRKNRHTSFLTRFYGISYDSITQNFIMVTEYADKGDLKKNIMEPVEFTNYNFRDNDYYEFSTNKRIIFVRGLRPEIPPQLSIPNYIKELMEKCWDSDPTNRPTAEQIIIMLNGGPNQRFLENSHRKKVCLLKIMNLIGNHPGTCYTSRFLSFQSVKEHLSRSTLEDSGKNNLSLPTSINNDDFIRDFGDEIIALPTLPNTSVTSLPRILERKHKCFNIYV